MLCVMYNSLINNFLIMQGMDLTPLGGPEFNPKDDEEVCYCDVYHSIASNDIIYYFSSYQQPTTSLSANRELQQAFLSLLLWYY